MDADISYILDNIISKSSYNQELGIYQIKEEDYNNAKLSDEQIKLLKRICLSSGIIIEYTHNDIFKLPKTIDDNLFNTYNELKTILINTQNQEEKNTLETKRIEIRNKIVINNIKFIKTIINQILENILNFKELSIKIDKEELYQIGYEIMLIYIDNSYLDKKAFSNNISYLLLLYIRKTNTTKEGIIQKNEISNVSNTIIGEITDISLINLSKILNIPIEEIKRIFNIENTLTSSNISIEEEIDTINEQIKLSENSTFESSPLYDDTLEDKISEYLRNEYILKLIETLPLETERQVIILYFGLNGVGEHTTKKIASKLGINQKNVIESLEKALKDMKESIRLKYLRQVFELPIYDFRTNKPIEEIPYTIYKSYRKLELFLLQHLEKKQILELVDTLNPIFKENLFLHLGYYEELNIYSFSSYKDIITYKFSIKHKNYTEQALIYLRKKIKKLYVDNNPNEEINTYLDYLMNNYLNKSKIKTRKLS